MWSLPVFSIFRISGESAALRVPTKDCNLRLAKWQSFLLLFHKVCYFCWPYHSVCVFCTQFQSKSAPSKQQRFWFSGPALPGRNTKLDKGKEEGSIYPLVLVFHWSRVIPPVLIHIFPYFLGAHVCMLVCSMGKKGETYLTNPRMVWRHQY